jgi:hypothetical protein
MFNAIPIKIPMTYITKIEKSTLKFMWRHKIVVLMAKITYVSSNVPENSHDHRDQGYDAVINRALWELKKHI